MAWVAEPSTLSPPRRGQGANLHPPTKRAWLVAVRSSETQHRELQWRGQLRRRRGRSPEPTYSQVSQGGEEASVAHLGRRPKDGRHKEALG
jgi:hypothetical protein